MRWEFYVEKISESNLSNPFAPLYWEYGVEEIRRISEHEGLKVGDKVLLKVEKNKFKYAVIDYIIEVITYCELSEEKVFLLKDLRGLCFSHAFVFNPKQIIHVEKFGLRKNSVLLTESIGSVGIFDWGDYSDVDQYRVLKCKADKRDNIGSLDYINMPPPLSPDVSLEVARNLALSKNAPSRFRKHISKMSILDDSEIKELKGRGFSFIIAKDVLREDGFIS